MPDYRCFQSTSGPSIYSHHILSTFHSDAGLSSLRTRHRPSRLLWLHHPRLTSGHARSACLSPAPSRINCPMFSCGVHKLPVLCRFWARGVAESDRNLRSVKSNRIEFTLYIPSPNHHATEWILPLLVLFLK